MVDKVKEFTRTFVQRLDDERYRGRIDITWSIGGLHFSDVQEVFSDFTRKEEFIRKLGGIKYLGNGTYIDCALKRVEREMHHYHAEEKPLLFSVVITDGYETRHPCGGIRKWADELHKHEINVFSVATTNKMNKDGLNEIASYPTLLYRDDYIAWNTSGTAPKIGEETITKIIKTMVIKNIFLP